MSKNVSLAKTRKSFAHKHTAHPEEFVQHTPSQKTRTWKQYIPEALLVLGFCLLTLWGGKTYLSRRSLHLNQKLVSAYQTQTLARKPRPTRISIRNLVNVGVEEAVVADNTWYVSSSSATHVAQSANPGESGNIIIYGHNRRDILGNIRSLNGDEKVTVTTDDGAQHEYKIIAFYEVDPEQVQFLAPTTDETLTIYTCSGLLEQNRFIIRAVPTTNIISQIDSVGTSF